MTTDHIPEPSEKVPAVADPRSSEGLGAGAGAPRWWHCDTHGPGSRTAWGCPECVREMRAEIKALRHALARLIDSDPAGAIATATDDELRAAWHDTQAECVVREQAGSVLEARALLGRLKAPNAEVSGCLRAPMPEDARRTAAGSPLHRPVGPVAGA